MFECSHSGVKQATDSENDAENISHIKSFSMHSRSIFNWKLFMATVKVYSVKKEVQLVLIEISIVSPAHV